MLLALDIFFIVFHSTLILFVLFGWISVKTRKAHLVMVGLTGGSWFILGIFYGIGFCPLTEWHWQVLRQMGETGLPVSYVQYILHRLLGISITASFADKITLLGLMIPAALSVYLHLRDFRRSRRQQPGRTSTSLW